MTKFWVVSLYGDSDTSSLVVEEIAADSADAACKSVLSRPQVWCGYYHSEAAVFLTAPVLVEN